MKTIQRYHQLLNTNLLNFGGGAVETDRNLELDISIGPSPKPSLNLIAIQIIFQGFYSSTI